MRSDVSQKDDFRNLLADIDRLFLRPFSGQLPFDIEAKMATPLLHLGNSSEAGHWGRLD
jgi:hypothetical protein